MLQRPTANLIYKRPYWQQEKVLEAIRSYLATMEHFGVVLDPVTLDERLARLVRRLLDGFDLADGFRPA